MRRLELWLLVVSTLVLSVTPARAHAPFEVTAVAEVGEADVTLWLTMAPSTALLLTRGVDQASGRPEPGALFRMTSGGTPLGLRSLERRVTQERDVELVLSFERPVAGPLRFEAVLLERLRETREVALRVTSREPATLLATALLTREEPSLVVADPALFEREHASAPAPPFFRVFTLGVRHVLSGYDHLLFLGGLLVACRRLRSMLGVVTSFAVAHSVTLALGGLGLVHAPSHVIEPLIAASIVFVGVENLWLGEERPRRSWLAFAFGLVHGLGFAGAFGELELGRSDTSLVATLLAFNLGVEAGQVAVVLVAFPVLAGLRGRGWFERRAFCAASLVVALLGTHWLVMRTWGATCESAIAAEPR